MSQQRLYNVVLTSFVEWEVSWYIIKSAKKIKKSPSGFIRKYGSIDDVLQANLLKTSMVETVKSTMERSSSLFKNFESRLGAYSRQYGN